jgi:alpha-glucuronidase
MAQAMSDNGSKLWLRYDALDQAAAQRYRPIFRRVSVAGGSATANAIRHELLTGLSSLLGVPVRPEEDETAADIIVGTPATSPLVRDLRLHDDLAAAGPEGFLIRSSSLRDGPITVIASRSEVGALYGAFHLLRMIQCNPQVHTFQVLQRPRLQRRLLNHWDNLDGSIERGYAGKSLWQWDDPPDLIDQRHTAYARANASLGINGTVLNNVNANPRILTGEYLRKVAALGNVFRPYGLRVYLSVNFASPRMIGGLATNDALDPAVVTWWRNKADEIYALIPDFGGFLVKANSEGQPGPQDYGRTHADGANTLADALAPHGGIVMWRAFVYDADVDPDRVKRAYVEFTRLDGQFRPNVTIQVKNGPLDFMPREPFHPLFGAMRHTPVMAEVQPAHEYTGHAKHLVYLGTMWKEFLDAETYARGMGSAVGRVLEGSVHPYAVTGMAAVANTGSDANWTGHDFSQSNWYAFGRLAWDHELPAEHIAEEWIRQTWSREPRTVETIRGMMMSSRETFVSYTMPLGLHHLIGGDHYPPQPWNDIEPRDDWTATYYHRADEQGIGFDRTDRGSNAVAQYFPPLRDIFNDPAQCPEQLLLWFHHLPWDHKLRSGRTVWDELCHLYTQGAREAAQLERDWQALEGKIDPERYRAVAQRLAIQVKHAARWRDQCLAYFQRFSQKPTLLSGGTK